MKHLYNIYQRVAFAILVVLVSGACTNMQAQMITTVAGNGSTTFSGDGGPATAAGIPWSYGIAKDNSGNLFISDWNSHRIRKVNSSGIITTIAGTGVAGVAGDGGPATAAQIGWVYGIAVDGSGNLYLADWNYARIRKIDAAGIITTFAGTGTWGFSGDGGPATSANIGGAWGIACDGSGNVYFSDWNNARIRKVNSSGIISTFAGTGTFGYSGDGGPATAATMQWGYGVAADPSGNVYFAEWNAGRIRKVNTSGIISTYAGNSSLGFSGDGGPASAAQLSNVYGIGADGGGNLYIADWGNNRLRRVTSGGTISTIAGTGTISFSGDGGPATSATFNRVFSVAADGGSNVYISDYYNHRVRMIIGNNRTPRFIAGDTIGLTVCANTSFDSINTIMAVIDSDTWQMETWTILTGPTHGTIAGTYSTPTTGLILTPVGMYYTPTPGYVGMDTFRIKVDDGYARDTATVIVTVNPTPTTITGALSFSVGSFSSLSSTPTGGIWSSAMPAIAVVGSGTGVVTGVSLGTTRITYTHPTNGCINTTTVNVFGNAGRMISTVAGNGSSGFSGDAGQATAAQLNYPRGVAVDVAGNFYIADAVNNRVRRVNTSTGIITTIAGTGTAGFSGDGGAATAAQLNTPVDIKLDGAGNIFIADNGNQRIRKISTTGTISTIAGTGTSGSIGDSGPATMAQLNDPRGVAVDASGRVYIADYGNNRVRVIQTTGVINAFAGTGTAGFSGDGSAATAAQLNQPSGLAVDFAGNVIIADYSNSRIRRVSTSNIISTIAGTGGGYSGDGGAATTAGLAAPYDVDADNVGNIYVSANYRVRQINSSGVINTIAGGSSSGFTGDGCAATASLIGSPPGVAVDGAGVVYFSDATTNRVRRISSNHAPLFAGGHIQNALMCMNSVDSINAMMAITDVDNGQSESWSVILSPLHGTVVATYAATSTGGTVTPVGLSYTPTIGYTGLDSFRVLVNDCSGGTDTTLVRVTINPPPTAITGSPTVCEGYTTMFVLAGTGLWSSSDVTVATVGSTGLVTGVAAGEATITFSPGASCSVTKSITVNPAPSPISGSASVCIGFPVTFTDASPGGVWSSSNPAIVTVGSSSGLVTGVFSGPAIITYTQGGCTAVLPVTVSTVPPLITGVTTICVGQTTTLFNIPGGTWSSSNPAVGSVDPVFGVVYGISAGSPVITYTLPTGCYTTTLLSSPVNILPLPTAIIGPSSMCVGTTVTMTDLTSGGLWSATGVGTSVTVGSLSGDVTGVADGIATIVYTIPSTGCSATKDMTVNAAPAPITGPSSGCVGSTITLSTTCSGSGSATWSSSNTAIATVGSSSGIVTGVSAGTVSITCFCNGCYVTKTVTMNALPAPITGASSVCVGLSTTLSSTTSGGTWSSGSPAIAAVGSTSGAVIGGSAGVSVITYTAASGCYTTRNMTVNSSPAGILGSPSACLGSTTTYSNAITGGSWTSGTTSVAGIGGTSGILSPFTLGTTTITYSLGAGCSTSMVVTVNPVPLAITGTLSLCVSSLTTLSNGSPGGTWSASGVSASIGASSGVVTGLATGLAPVTYTLPTGCYRTATATVNPLPAAISGASSVCPGGTITLTDATIGGTWSSSNPSIASVGSLTGIVSGVVPGAVTISYIVASTGCAITKTVSVSALPAVITGPGAVCPANTITLSCATGGGTWSTLSGTATVGATTGVVTGVAAGTALISYTVGSGCPRTTTVTVNPLPSTITGPTALCVGATITETSTPGGTWTSSTPSVATIGASSGVVSGVAMGTTTIVYTLPTGCTTSTTVSVTLSPAAIAGSPNVCVGATTLLTNSVSGGAWFSSSPTVATVGSLTGDVTGVAAGVTTITYSLGTGCTVIKPMTVMVAPVAITGSANVCVGTTTTLSDATPGGSWSSASPGTATVSTGGVVNGVAVGVVTISYSAAGCAATKDVTVNPTPAAITGPASVCAGSNITQANTVSGGLWSTTSAGISIGSVSGIVAGITSGPASITYSIGGCNATRILSVNPVSSIGGATGVCVGASSTLTAVGGGTWSSSTPSVASIGATSGIVSGVTPGTTTITYSLSSGCLTTTVVTVNLAPSAISGTTNLCIGATTTLTNGAGGGVWSSSNPTIAGVGSLTGIVTGGAAGTVSISYSLGSGCTVSIPVTVNPGPLAITGASQVCVGANIILSDATPGGTWSSSDPFVASIGATSGNVSGVSAGSATISYTTGAGCPAIKNIVVHPAVSAISGTTHLCTSLTTSLSNGSPGGVWTSSNPSIAGVGSGTGLVSGVIPGTVTITYTLPTGCTATTPVTVNSAPAMITGSTLVCIGSTTTLSDITPGGTWSSSNPAIASIGVSSGVVTGMAIGTADISYSAGGCPAVTVVTVNALPGAIGGPGNVCAGASVNLTNASPGGIWSSSNTVIATVGSSTGAVNGLSPGTTSISYSLGAGCTVSKILTVNPAPPGIIGSSNICIGATTTLFDPLPGGTWTSGNTSLATVGSTGIVTGMAGGVVGISYTSPTTGCATVHNMTVVTVSSISGIDALCAWGDTMSISNTELTGAYSSSLVTVLNLGGGRGFVTAHAPGTATVTYTLPSGCSATATFTVNPLPSAITGNIRLCTGQTGTLANTATGGIWASSNPTVATIGSSTGAISGLVPGTTSVTYTLATGCSVDTVVNVLSHPSAIAGVGEICNGAATLFTNSTIGGAWSSSNPGIALAGTLTGLISGVSAGSATITYTMAPACLVTHPITINALPTVYSVTGGGNYCSGAAGLAIGVGGSQTGIDYQLYRGTTPVGTPVAGTGSGISFGLHTLAGTYTVTAVNTTTICSGNMGGTATIGVIPSVVPAVTIATTPNDTVCNGTYVMFTATPVNGGTAPVYAWELNGSSVGTSTPTYSHLPANGDIVKVTVTSSETCATPAAVSATENMTVLDILTPVVTITATPGTTIEPGETVTFVASVVNGGTTPTFQWTINGVPVPGATGSTFIHGSFANGDTVRCLVVNSGLCGGQTGSNHVVILIDNSGVGVVTVTGEGLLQVQPNPNKGLFTIKGALGAITDEDVTVEVTNMLGQTVYKGHVVKRNGKLDTSVQLSGALANGMYMLTVRSESAHKVFHIVVEQ